MKKYTIKDSLGNKKTIYAENIAHALTFVDSKVRDEASLAASINALVTDEKAAIDSKVRDIDASSLMTLFTKYGKPYDYACKTRPKMSSSGSKYLGQLVAYTLSPIGKYDADKARNFVDFLNKKGYEALIFAPNIVVKLKQARSSRLYIRRHERTSQYDSKVRDEASLAASINALVTDEKAAIDAYNVAINNLKGKIDDNAMQVLINIMKDERRHVENLYAILNGQVTEKNLKDSKMRDSLNEAKNLVESAGFKVLRAYGSDNEPYITVRWDGSYSELNRKVRALKSDARKIGYKDVYTDGNDICFSKY